MLWWKKHSWNCSFYCFCYCIIAVSSSLQATRTIEVLKLPTDLSPQQCALTTWHVQNLRKLRFLLCHGLKMMGDFEHQLPKLRWLSWHKCPGDFKATNLNLEKLAVLDLSKSSITEDWEGWKEIKVRTWFSEIFVISKMIKHLYVKFLPQNTVNTVTDSSFIIEYSSIQCWRALKIMRILLT